MSFEIIQPFQLAKSSPVDEKALAANQTARLSIYFPWRGLQTTQTDTYQLFEYVGNGVQNTIPDWQQHLRIFNTYGIPSVTLGSIYDIAVDKYGYGFYEKTSGTVWDKKFDFRGSRFYSGSGIPSVSLGADNDIY